MGTTKNRIATRNRFIVSQSTSINPFSHVPVKYNLRNTITTKNNNSTDDEELRCYHCGRELLWSLCSSELRAIAAQNTCAGWPCNRFASHSHNFLGFDGAKPSEISNLGRDQIQQNYDTLEFHEGLAEKGEKNKDGVFEIRTDQGEVFSSKKLIFATGVKDLVPDIPGFAECWGNTIISCPYCHGYELRAQPTVLFGTGPAVVQKLPLLRNLSRDIMLLTNGQEPEFTDEERNSLQRNDITMDATKVKQIQHTSGVLDGVLLEDDRLLSNVKVMYAILPFEQACSIPHRDFSCEQAEITSHIKVDFMQKTSVYGVFACGDCTTMFRSVATAIYQGQIAGAMVNKELSDEEFAAA
jgi:thioredoxin reductase